MDEELRQEFFYAGAPTTRLFVYGTTTCHAREYDGDSGSPKKCVQRSTKRKILIEDELGPVLMLVMGTPLHQCHAGAYDDSSGARNKSIVKQYRNY